MADPQDYAKLTSPLERKYDNYSCHGSFKESRGCDKVFLVSCFLIFVSVTICVSSSVYCGVAWSEVREIQTELKKVVLERDGNVGKFSKVSEALVQSNTDTGEKYGDGKQPRQTDSVVIEEEDFEEVNQEEDYDEVDNDDEFGSGGDDDDNDYDDDDDDDESEWSERDGSVSEDGKDIDSDQMSDIGSGDASSDDEEDDDEDEVDDEVHTGRLRTRRETQEKGRKSGQKPGDRKKQSRTKDKTKNKGGRRKGQKKNKRNGKFLSLPFAHYDGSMSKEETKKLVDKEFDSYQNIDPCTYINKLEGTMCLNQSFVPSGEPLNIFKPTSWTSAASSPMLYDETFFTAKNNGVHLAYAQILFDGNDAIKSASIVQKRNGSKVATLNCHVGVLPLLSESRRQSCTMIGLLNLKKGDVIKIHNNFKPAMVERSEGDTYFGIIQISKP